MRATTLDEQPIDLREAEEANDDMDRPSSRRELCLDLSGSLSWTSKWMIRRKGIYNVIPGYGCSLLLLLLSPYCP